MANSNLIAASIDITKIDKSKLVADKVENVSNAQQNAPRVEEAGDDLPF